jgi:hypothetical protein
MHFSVSIVTAVNPKKFAFLPPPSYAHNQLDNVAVSAKQQLPKTMVFKTKTSTKKMASETVHSYGPTQYQAKITEINRVTQGTQRTVKPLIPEEPGTWNTQEEPDDCTNHAECQVLYPWNRDCENNYRYQLVHQPKARQKPDEVASAEIQHVRTELRL